MNETIKTLKNHRSFRSYLDKDVPEELLNEMIESSQAAPSWINGQQVTVIAVKDPARKQKLAELCGNQAHIKEAPVFLIFCADFYRAQLAAEKENVTLEALDDIDALLVGAADVGLAMGNAIAAAESSGLGIVPIGGIRRNPLEVIELLELPKYVLPISGLCVGYGAEDPGQKPRLPKEAVYHQESYNSDLQKTINTYDETYSEYMKKRTNGEKDTTWSEAVTSFYKQTYYPSIAQMVEQQGFTCKNIKKL
ncbi:NADPH-dependent oxidoreductase [Bacillus taeanensis]|uniref:NADPH-dependent oxidoreductase n=1 Tax=Bacillus taeanensis TaxID=273032 RepID=A0A366XTN6_9BACI|nr:NADPH-dependent oxidoreductase [Bacillus taeanensis]RBW69267.1 NADPH-dependent oxidoreductase [Bacillus taeanensis]